MFIFYDSFTDHYIDTFIVYDSIKRSSLVPVSWYYYFLFSIVFYCLICSVAGPFGIFPEYRRRRAGPGPWSLFPEPTTHACFYPSSKFFIKKTYLTNSPTNVIINS